MKKLLLVVLLLLLARCATPYVEEIVSPQGSVLTIGNVRFEIPENSVADSILIRIEKRGAPKRSYEQGFLLSGELFVIKPESLIFEKPLLFSYPVSSENAALGVKIGKGFVPVAGSGVEGETLKAHICHGGEYYVIQEPEHYGMRDHSETKEGLLIVSDIYVSDYIKNFKKTMRQGGYDFPIWTFIYSNEKSIEDNALFLKEELKKLHEQYGDFRLDIVSFGIGGLIAQHYVADTTLYQKDISSAIIAIGTPFFGSSFASRDNAKKAKSPFRFFFIDGLGKNAKDLEPESDFISWLRKHKGLPGGHYYDRLEENKNFASLSGEQLFDGDSPEEFKGDGLVSVSSTMLTPIEPEPFTLDHFSLFEDRNIHNTINDFLQLYRSFNWPLIFTKIWKGEEEFAKISAIWEREVMLILHNMNDFEVLLEYNENMLKSTPENAILITNGDNDTYPAWYLQEWGVRRDVLIVNRNLFNLKENVRFLQKQGLPLEITHEELDKIKHKMEDDKFVTVSDQLIELLLTQDKRPVVFSTTVYKPQRYGYPLKLSGLVYEIGEEDVDIERTKELIHKTLSFDKLFSTPIESLSVHIQNLSKNYAAVAFQLSMALGLTEGNEEALHELEFAMRFSEEPVFYYKEAMAYMNLKKKDVADSIFKMLMEMPSIDLEMKKRIAQAYSDNDMKEKAIRLLADCLKDNPEDKEIPELIKKYQEE